MPSNDTLIAVAWLLYGWTYLDTGVNLARIARAKTGTLEQWPVPGRWLLAASYLVMALPFLDVVRIRTEPAWLEPHWSSNPSSWWVVALRYLPLPVLLWTRHRIKRRGLVNP